LPIIIPAVTVEQCNEYQDANKRKEYRRSIPYNQMLWFWFPLKSIDPISYPIFEPTKQRLSRHCITPKINNLLIFTPITIALNQQNRKY
jgi:hypothetical protein